VGSSTSHKPIGLHGLLRGWLHFFTSQISETGSIRYTFEEMYIMLPRDCHRVGPGSVPVGVMWDLWRYDIPRPCNSVSLSINRFAVGADRAAHWGGGVRTNRRVARHASPWCKRSHAVSGILVTLSSLIHLKMELRAARHVGTSRVRTSVPDSLGFWCSALWRHCEFQRFAGI
jgi:hypothetical protein